MTEPDVDGHSEQQVLTEERMRARKSRAAVLAFITLLTLVICVIGLLITAPVPDVTGMGRSEAADVLERAGFSAEVAEDVVYTAEAGAEGEAAADGEAIDAVPGTVVTQAPSPGARVLKGTRVRIALAGAAPSSQGEGEGFITPSGDSALSDYPVAADGGRMYPSSSGTTPADNRPVIPLVGNLTEAQALAVLRDAGYRGVVGGYNPTTAGVSAGRVYYQSPPFGSQAARGTTVTIWVSTGAPPQPYWGTRP